MSNNFGIPNTNSLESATVVAYFLHHVNIARLTLPPVTIAFSLKMKIMAGSFRFRLDAMTEKMQQFREPNG